MAGILGPDSRTSPGASVRLPSQSRERVQLDNSQKQRINESMDVFGRGCGVCGQLMEELSIRIHGPQLGAWIDGRFLVSALFYRLAYRELSRPFW
jgi:hypothetical protein